MSKAEERALEQYPKRFKMYGSFYGNGRELKIDVNAQYRNVYIEGYQQAEKDSELTWKDMLLLADIEQDVFNHSDSPLKGVQAAYEEVLKRFKDFKERKEK